MFENCQTVSNAVVQALGMPSFCLRPCSLLIPIILSTLPASLFGTPDTLSLPETAHSLWLLLLWFLALQQRQQQQQLVMRSNPGSPLRSHRACFGFLGYHCGPWGAPWRGDTCWAT
jgi:hypothetical protein